MANAMQGILEQQALQVAQLVEQQIDAQIDVLENLGDDDLAAIRRNRIQQMKAKAAKAQEWRQKGHGEYSEIQNEKDWFAAVKASERVVCHFFRGTTWRCQIIDRHMAALAPKHLETRFIKIDAEKCNFLAQRLEIVLMPTIIMTKDTMTHDRIEGFDELGGRDDFTTKDFERRLAKRGIIDFEEELVPQKRKEFHNSSNKSGAAVYGGHLNPQHEWDSDAE